MRVCLISREFPPDTAYGGIGTFSYHLAKGLIELGHDVEVIASARDFSGLQIQEGIPVHRVQPYGSFENLEVLPGYLPYATSMLGTSSGIWQKFIELHSKRPFDVIDSPEHLAEGLMPAISKQAPMLVRLYTPHSKLIDCRLHNLDDSLDNRLVSISERLSMLNSDVLTSPSLDLARFVSRDLNYPLDKIKIVRNPIDITMFSPDGERTQLSSSGKTTITYIGRLEERKGIQILLEAIPRIVKRFPQVEFIIIGNEVEDQSDEFSKRAISERVYNEGVSDNVRLIDRVPLKDLPAIYRASDINIIPSLYDNSPYTCVEAMACGGAVIGTTAGGTKEYMEHEVSGLVVKENDSVALEKACVRLLMNVDEREEFGRNARRHAVENYDHVKIARQTQELYEEAQYNFSKTGEAGLYRRNARELLLDTEEILVAFDRLLFEQLQKNSLRFRILHCLQSAMCRPKLTFAKVILRILGALGIRKFDKQLNLTDKLDEAIRRKSEPPESLESLESLELDQDTPVLRKGSKVGSKK